MNQNMTFYLFEVLFLSSLDRQSTILEIFNKRKTVIIIIKRANPHSNYL